MAEVSREDSGIQVGIESSHGFGDGLFNVPLVEAISQKHGVPVTVAVSNHCADAFANYPFIKVLKIAGMNFGMKHFEENEFDYAYQITQNVKFYKFREADPNHSLIDTPKLVGEELGLTFDQRPLFSPTAREMEVGAGMSSGMPTIAIESVYKSQQSWAGRRHIEKIFDHFKETHRILWLSNEGAPDHKNVDDMLRLSRRECIMSLQHCEYFFSVGSGFFCASLALPRELQPKNVVCLWTDSLYRYEKVLKEKGWHPEITWINNEQKLEDALSFIGKLV